MSQRTPVERSCPLFICGRLRSDANTRFRGGARYALDSTTVDCSAVWPAKCNPGETRWYRNEKTLYRWSATSCYLCGCLRERPSRSCGAELRIGEPQRFGPNRWQGGDG